MLKWEHVLFEDIFKTSINQSDWGGTKVNKNDNKNKKPINQPEVGEEVDKEGSVQIFAQLVKHKPANEENKYKFINI